ncbi:hypothetical protein RFH42_02485 [Acinetobacter rudis]|nr:hypothetical protein [Acinetobacter rudis]MDQ8951823.1 hypothetical protein [Acinetobacter rudis]
MILILHIWCMVHELKYGNTLVLGGCSLPERICGNVKYEITL